MSDGIVGVFFRIGSPSRNANGLISPPSNRPINGLGGFASPVPISNPRAQCSSICAADILPHWRGLAAVTK